jgi:hypothetical protein
MQNLGFSILLAAITVFLGTGSAKAQSYPTCYNAQNIPVIYMANPNIPDIAIARTAPDGTPIVLWNPNIVFAQHPDVVEFFYYHECAHHALAHPLGTYGPGSERAADCWAKQTMWSVGVLSNQKYANIVNGLAQNSTPGMDWPNGNIRVSFLNSC